MTAAVDMARRSNKKRRGTDDVAMSRMKDKGVEASVFKFRSAYPKPDAFGSREILQQGS
jgi:hypothetical protein